MKNVLTIFMIFIINTTALAQDSEVSGKPKGGEPGWEPPKKVVYSEKDIKEECRKYEGKYIVYYGKMFMVKSCQRTLLNRKEVTLLMRTDLKVTEVDINTIAMIPLVNPAGRIVSSTEDCRRLNGNYVLSTGGDMYYVRDCKKYLFPDWESYLDHVKSKPGDVLELEDFELDAVAMGGTLDSTLDKEFSQANVEATETDMIPIEEACREINGATVSYYSKIYKIENCRKREIEDTARWTRENSNTKVNELTPEQWLSIPNGVKVQ